MGKQGRGRQKRKNTMRVPNADASDRLGSGDPSPTRSKRRRVALGAPDPSSAAAGEGKRALFHCNYCGRDISGNIRVKCAQCNDFDLCLECFSVGVELTPHKNNHAYRVIDNLSFPLISPDWMADEEMLLLEGVEMYGLGNWAEVAEHVGVKTAGECYEHYMAAYMDSPFAPLPDLSHLAGKTKSDLLALAKTIADGKRGFPTVNDGLKMVKQEPSISPARGRMDEGKDRDVSADRRSPSTSSKGLKDEKPLFKVMSKQDDGGEGIGGPASHDLGAPKGTVAAARKTGGGQTRENSEGATGVSEDGAHSNRSLGVKKPKPSAEDIKPGINGIDQSGYNAKRDEFDTEYDNDAEGPLSEMDFKETDTETDRELKIRMLNIYNARLDERKRRKEFILSRGLLNVKAQQALDRKRSKEERELHNRAKVFMRYHSQEDHDSLLEGLLKERRLRQRIEELQELRRAGCQTLGEGEAYISEKKRRETEANARKARESASYLYRGKVAHRSNRYVNRDRDADPTSAGNLKEPQKSRGAGAHHPLSSSMLPSSGRGARRETSPLDLSGLSGTELLSQAEQELCSQCRLFPAHYLQMKEKLMLESLKKGQVRRAVAYGMFKVDPVKTDRVFELLAGRGWIQGDSPPMLPPPDR